MNVRPRMKRLRARRPSPAMVVSIVALVVATAGTATAARVLISSPSQVKSNVLSGRHIKNGSLSGSDIKSASITSKQIRKSTLNALKASSSSAETALEVFRKNGPEKQAENAQPHIATLKGLAPGSYAIFGKTTITGVAGDGGLLSEAIRGDKVSTAHCKLNAGGPTDDSFGPVSVPYGELVSSINMQITASFGSPTDVFLQCEANTIWRASDTSIIAIRLGRTERSEVGG